MPVVVLGVTGCIGAYKACEVLRELQRREVDVHVVMTAAATRFVTPMTFEALSRHPVFHDQWALGSESDIRHISLADEADLLLVAPATANILGKFARGIADDALSTLYTATRAPVLVAPAMNVNMFEHPAVRENLAILRARGRGRRRARLAATSPAAGWARGAWPRSGEIVDAAMAVARPPPRPRGRDRARHRGAHGRGHRPRALRLEPLLRADGLPPGRGGARPRARRWSSSRGRRASGRPPASRSCACARPRRCSGRWPIAWRPATVVVAAAAVSDYRPASASPSKIKKTDGPVTLELVRTPDILRGLGEAKGGRVLVGFAAETEDVVGERAEEARGEEPRPHRGQRRHARPGAGFGGETNAVVLLGATGAGWRCRSAQARAGRAHPRRGASPCARRAREPPASAARGRESERDDPRRPRGPRALPRGR